MIFNDIARIQHDNDIFYIEFFDYETVEDIKYLLVKKYDFIDNEELSFFQNFKKLENDQKLKELRDKQNIYLKGSKKPKKLDKNEEISDSSSGIDYISKFHDMGFKDSDDTIKNLIQKKGNNLVEVTATLLKERKKTI